MTQYTPGAICKLTSRVLALILLLNFTALGAMGLEAQIASIETETPAPCHQLTATAEDSGKDRVLGHDSCCKQCIGFIPVVSGEVLVEFFNTGYMRAAVEDPVPSYTPPLYKPPRRLI